MHFFKKRWKKPAADVPQYVQEPPLIHPQTVLPPGNDNPMFTAPTQGLSQWGPVGTEMQSLKKFSIPPGQTQRPDFHSLPSPPVASTFSSHTIHDKKEGSFYPPQKGEKNSFLPGNPSHPSLAHPQHDSSSSESDDLQPITSQLKKPSPSLKKKSLSFSLSSSSSSSSSSASAAAPKQTNKPLSSFTPPIKTTKPSLGKPPQSNFTPPTTDKKINRYSTSSSSFGSISSSVQSKTSQPSAMQQVPNKAALNKNKMAPDYTTQVSTKHGKDKGQLSSPEKKTISFRRSSISPPVKQELKHDRPKKETSDTSRNATKFVWGHEKQPETKVTDKMITTKKNVLQRGTYHAPAPVRQSNVTETFSKKEKDQTERSPPVFPMKTRSSLTLSRSSSTSSSLFDLKNGVHLKKNFKDSPEKEKDFAYLKQTPERKERIVFNSVPKDVAPQKMYSPKVGGANPPETLETQKILSSIETTLKKMTDNSLQTLGRDLKDDLRHTLVQYFEQEIKDFQTRAQGFQETCLQKFFEMSNKNNDTLKEYSSYHLDKVSHWESQINDLQKLVHHKVSRIQTKRLDALQAYMRSLTGYFKDFEQTMAQQYQKQQEAIFRALNTQWEKLQRFVEQQLLVNRNLKEKGYRDALLRMQQLLKKKKRKIHLHKQSLQHLLKVNSLVKLKIQEMEQEENQQILAYESKQREMESALNQCVLFEKAKDFAAKAFLKGRAVEHLASQVLNIQKAQLQWAFYKFLLESCHIHYAKDLVAPRLLYCFLQNQNTFVLSEKRLSFFHLVHHCFAMTRKLTWAFSLALNCVLSTKISKIQQFALSRLSTFVKQNKLHKARENFPVFFVLLLNCTLTSVVIRQKYNAFSSLLRDVHEMVSNVEKDSHMHSKAYTLKYDEKNYLKWLPRTPGPPSLLPYNSKKTRTVLPQHYVLVDSLITSNSSPPPHNSFLP